MNGKVFLFWHEEEWGERKREIVRVYLIFSFTYRSCVSCVYFGDDTKRFYQTDEQKYMFFFLFSLWRRYNSRKYLCVGSLFHAISISMLCVVCPCPCSCHIRVYTLNTFWHGKMGILENSGFNSFIFIIKSIKVDGGKWMAEWDWNCARCLLYKCLQCDQNSTVLSTLFSWSTQGKKYPKHPQ